MPVYEFRCPKCGKESVLTLTLAERAKGPKCPGCNVPLEPLITSFYSKTSRKS